jgi:hypothetical protein
MVEVVGRDKTEKGKLNFGHFAATAQLYTTPAVHYVITPLTPRDRNTACYRVDRCSTSFEG